MKINPCPNPKCVPLDIPRRPSVEVIPVSSNEGYFVRCNNLQVCGGSCGMNGPIRPTSGLAIAAWNSITMGWMPGETAPRDGALIQAVMRTSKPVHVVWIDRSEETSAGPEWFCPESGESYFPGDLIAWHPIPPMPEGK
jgi:hypothetical protein